MRVTFLCATALIVASLSLAVPAVAANPRTPTGVAKLRAQVKTLGVELAAQKEARDRQADAFDAATSQVEIVNGALAIILALGGIAATVLGLRWVRSYTEQRVAERIDESIREAGTKVFAQAAEGLVDEYDRKFAEAYSKYHGLLERDG